MIRYKDHWHDRELPIRLRHLHNYTSRILLIEVILWLSAAPQFTVSKDKLSRSLLALPVGNSVKLDCSAEGHPRPIVTWYKDGARFLERKGGSRLHLDQWTLLLNILDLVPTDTGKYTCNVSNAYGWINHTYYVDVHGKIKVPDSRL